LCDYSSPTAKRTRRQNEVALAPPKHRPFRLNGRSDLMDAVASRGATYDDDGSKDMGCRMLETVDVDLHVSPEAGPGALVSKGIGNYSWLRPPFPQYRRHCSTSLLPFCDLLASGDFQALTSDEYHHNAIASRGAASPVVAQLGCRNDADPNRCRFEVFQTSVLDSNEFPRICH